MNKYEQRAAQQRRMALKSSTTMSTAAIALLVVILLILGLSGSAPSTFFGRGAVAVAIIWLIVRQLARRSRGKASKAAQPDPQSQLHLNE